MPPDVSLGDVMVGVLGSAALVGVTLGDFPLWHRIWGLTRPQTVPRGCGARFSAGVGGLWEWQALWETPPGLRPLSRGWAQGRFSARWEFPVSTALGGPQA